MNWPFWQSALPDWAAGHPFFSHTRVKSIDFPATPTAWDITTGVKTYANCFEEIMEWFDRENAAHGFPAETWYAYTDENKAGAPGWEADSHTPPYYRKQIIPSVSGPQLVNKKLYFENYLADIQAVISNMMASWRGEQPDGGYVTFPNAWLDEQAGDRRVASFTDYGGTGYYYDAAVARFRPSMFILGAKSGVMYLYDIFNDVINGETLDAPLWEARLTDEDYALLESDPSHCDGAVIQIVTYSMRNGLYVSLEDGTIRCYNLYLEPIKAYDLVGYSHVFYRYSYATGKTVDGIGESEESIIRFCAEDGYYDLDKSDGSLSAKTSWASFPIETISAPSGDHEGIFGSLSANGLLSDTSYGTLPKKFKRVCTAGTSKLVQHAIDADDKLMLVTKVEVESGMNQVPLMCVRTFGADRTPDEIEVVDIVRLRKDGSDYFNVDEDDLAADDKRIGLLVGCPDNERGGAVGTDGDDVYKTIFQYNIDLAFLDSLSDPSYVESQVNSLALEIKGYEVGQDSYFDGSWGNTETLWGKLDFSSYPSTITVRYLGTTPIADYASAQALWDAAGPVVATLNMMGQGDILYADIGPNIWSALEAFGSKAVFSVESTAAIETNGDPDAGIFFTYRKARLDADNYFNWRFDKVWEHVDFTLGDGQYATDLVIRPRAWFTGMQLMDAAANVLIKSGEELQLQYHSKRPIAWSVKSIAVVSGSDVISVDSGGKVSTNAGMASAVIQAVGADGRFLSTLGVRRWSFKVGIFDPNILADATLKNDVWPFLIRAMDSHEALFAGSTVGMMDLMTMASSDDAVCEPTEDSLYEPALGLIGKKEGAITLTLSFKAANWDPQPGDQAYSIEVWGINPSTSQAIAVEEALELAIDGTPTGALTWSSFDPAVAAVSGDDDGATVTGVAAGVTAILATDEDGVVSAIKVTVT